LLILQFASDFVHIFDIDGIQIVVDDLQQLEAFVGGGAVAQLLERFQGRELFGDVDDAEVFGVLDRDVVGDVEVPAYHVEEAGFEILQPYGEVDQRAVEPLKFDIQRDVALLCLVGYVFQSLPAWDGEWNFILIGDFLVNFQTSD